MNRSLTLRSSTRIQSFGSRVSGQEFRGKSFGARVSGQEFRGKSFGARVSGQEFRGKSFGARVSGQEFRGKSFGARVSGQEFRGKSCKIPTSRKKREIWGTRLGGRDRFCQPCSHARLQRSSGVLRPLTRPNARSGEVGRALPTASGPIHASGSPATMPCVHSAEFSDGIQTMTSTRLVSSLALALLASLSTKVYGAECASLKELKLADTTITTAEITSGDLEVRGEKPFHDLPAFCRVAGIMRPSADSEIHFEVWLPEKDWNHRLLGVGNGGFAGQIGYQSLAGNLSRGFATSGSDAGHFGESEDASWRSAIRKRSKTLAGGQSISQLNAPRKWSKRTTATYRRKRTSIPAPTVAARL